MLPSASQTAFLFPGQGSQAVGMGQALAQAYPVARDVYAQADDLLGFPLSALSWEGPEQSLNDTVNTQPALMAASVAALAVIAQLFPAYRPAFVAGHSMGELSALVAAGALPFSEALRLVRLRGEVMRRAGELAPGGMAAILGLDAADLEQICAQARSATEPVQVANDNCPGQVVISGSQAALQRAMQLALEAGARRAIPLAVSIAAHSALMESAQADFNRAVEAAPIVDPAIPILGNVSVQSLAEAEAIRADLKAQLTSPVRWTESVQAMLSSGVTTFIEIGSGSVLTGLLKRIDRQAIGFTLGTPEDFEKLRT